MARLFFLLSGENPTLPKAELIAVLESEGYRYRVLSTLPQVAVIEADPRCIKPVTSRCSLTRICGLEVFSCNAELSEILGCVRKVSLHDLIKPGQSFKVRVRRVGESSLELRTGMLEREIGSALLEALQKVKVQLEEPDKTFIGILSGGKFVFGMKMAEIEVKPFMERRPRKRPYFHPTTMPPKLARCIVNLARAKAGQLLLDPFCGAGGILIEAGLIGCRVAGSDVETKMIEGSLRNLRGYKIKPIGIVRADARMVPFDHVDCIVTDPPYGRSSTTLGVPTRRIISEFLTVVKHIIPQRGFFCIVSPKNIKVSELGKKRGFKLIETHSIYVHRSLSREIAVFKKR